MARRRAPTTRRSTCCTHSTSSRNAPGTNSSASQPISTEVHLAAGHVMCRQGGFEAEFFVIVDGDAGVDVDRTRVATLGRGSFFGEHALLEHSAANASVTAITPMTVLVLNRGEFETMLLDAPHTASMMLREISHRVNPT